MKQYDVVIVGGGMVGALSALSLSALSDSKGKKLNIALIEGQQAKTNWPKASFDMRVSALTRASENMLRRLGVWSEMEALAVYPYSDMHVWESTGSGEIHFDCADVGEPSLGHIVENRVTQSALWKKLQKQTNIEILSPAQASSLQVSSRQLDSQQQAQLAVLGFADRESISANLIVAADGARSWVREQIGIDVERGNYQQTAIVTTVKTSLSHQDTAWQCFLPTGPVAFLPFRDGYSSIVWSTATEQAEVLLQLDDKSFTEQLSEALQGRLGAITDIHPRAGFPLHHQHAKQYVRDNVVLIGDAAHSIHPLAGQGVNLGFADAACLRDVISHALLRHRNIGSYAELRRYERWRRGENSLTLNAMTGFKQLFGSTSPLLKTLRTVGLNTGQQITPLRNEIVRFAMGLRGDLSSLAKPRIE